MAKRERHKVALEVIVTPHGTVLSDDEQFLILRPPKTLYYTFIPLRMLAPLLLLSLCHCVP
jgi:hypothetical protein